MRVDESLLTGESLPVEKDAALVLPEGTPLAERRNLVFAGIHVAGGRALGLVVATAAETSVGEAALLLAVALPVRRRPRALEAARAAPWGTRLGAREGRHSLAGDGGRSSASSGQPSRLGVMRRRTLSGLRRYCIVAAPVATAPRHVSVLGATATAS